MSNKESSVSKEHFGKESSFSEKRLTRKAQLVRNG